MEISAAFLCDFAEVREGLLMSLGGGITRLWRTSYPASVGASLALLLDVSPSELSTRHEIAVGIQGPDQPVGEIKLEFQTGAGQELEPGEKVVVPLAIDLRPVQLPAAGSYSLNVSIDGRFLQAVSFVARPAGASPSPPMPPGSPPPG